MHNLFAQKPAVAVSAQDLFRLRDLYERGLVRQALDLALTLGPLPAWTGARAQIMAGRVAGNLGAPRLGRWLHFRAYRSAPQDAQAQAYFAATVLEQRGPLAAWKLLRLLEEGPGEDEASRDGRQYLRCLRARVFALMRDFERAEEWLKRAEQIDPLSPWLWTERAHLFELEDRYEEGLAAARHSLELRAWYRPGVQSTAHFLQLLDRDDEALELLEAAAQRFESVPVLTQLAILQIDLEKFSNAHVSLDAIAALSPILEEDYTEWLTIQRAQVAYYCGEFDAAARFARQTDYAYFQKFADRISQPGAARRRVKLSVNFVRQHHQTCAPATLTAISNFWNLPAEHLAVAEIICYDGTPAHSERHWAEQNGWIAREFTVTWEAAVVLLNRGVPFTLVTAEATSAHLQAVIGYDDLRGTLIIRDPYQYYAGEAVAEAFLQHYRARGPRGMALVPKAQAHLLDGLDLPDAALFDRLHALQRALFQHQRAEAQIVFQQMEADGPKHRLTLSAKRSLASYDQNTPALLACLNELLEQFPDDGASQLAKLSCLRELSRREDRLSLLEKLCAEPEADPVFWQEFAQELRADAREHEAAAHWLRRALRFRPTDAINLGGFADLLWLQRDFEQAVEMYRFAACLDDKKEQPARSYFSAARHLKQTQQALQFLQQRFERFGGKSGWPAITLFDALSEIDEVPQAFAVLEQALQRCPSDGDLLLFGATTCARWGKLDEAGKLLERANGRAPRVATLRAAADMAHFRGDNKAALSLWREALELEPLSMDGHRAVTWLLAEIEGRAAALQHLELACARFPHHFALHQLWINWLHEEGARAVEPIVRRLLEINPADAWSHRQLAATLAKQGRFPEAMAEADQALQLEPVHPDGFCVRGDLLLRQGHPDAARTDFQQALRLAVDTEFAIASLMKVSASLEERKQALSFIEQELIRQTVFGDGVLAFRKIARGILQPQELLTFLRQALTARPDLWHAWSAVILQLVDLQRLDEAEKLAREATERFPLLPRLWLDRAFVHQARLNAPEEAACLRQALQIKPAYGIASQRLADLHARAGEFHKSRKVLEDACAASPLDSSNHGCLADVLWKLDEKQEAIACIQHALELNPNYDWAWRALRQWAAEIGQPELAPRMARQLIVRRGGEARPWLLLAETLVASNEKVELHAALDKAIALQPRDPVAHDIKAAVLAREKRFEEALAACRPEAWGERPPVELRARAAWIEGERGDVKKAIVMMHVVVAENPGLFWGWQCLAGWHSNIGEHKAAIEAAQKMAELEPLNPTPLCYLGDMKLRSRDRAGAKEDFRRALALDPAYGYAGFSLFDLELEERNDRAAAELLAGLRQHVGGELVEARAAQLAAYQKQFDQALAILKKLCVANLDDPWPLSGIAETLDKLGRRREVDAVFREALALPDAAPLLGEVWVQRQLARDRWFILGTLDRLHKRGEIGRRAIIAYVNAMGKTVRQPFVRRGSSRLEHGFLLWRLLHRHRAWLAKDDQAWGTVGYTLTSMRRRRAVVKWLASWRDHPNAEPWMLSNLVVAFRDLGRVTEANEVCRAALRLPIRDHTSNDFALWLAVEELLAGDANRAAQTIDTFQASDFRPFMQKVFALADAVVKLRSSPQPEKKTAFKEARRRLNKEFAGACLRPYGKGMRRVFRRCVHRMAREYGGPWPAVWGYAKLYWPLS